MEYQGKTGSYFQVRDLDQSSSDIIKGSRQSELSLLWFQDNKSRLKIDDQPFAPSEKDIISLTEFHKIDIEYISSVKLLRWNKPFYCIINHDSEVGCKGILFYGAQSVPLIQPKEEDLAKFSLVWQMLEQEMISNDGLQEEMLQMMLKRILILTLRMYKEQYELARQKTDQVDIIREYNFLVEQHFRENHAVADYAQMLHKSPKTLSNLFKKIGSKSPSQFIKDRLMLEARRLLAYTDKTISEVGYDLGFVDVQSFSRFFKKDQGISPAEYRVSVS